jgi:succinate dehydrogenase / fumarate reductase flavoprotein subunit
LDVIFQDHVCAGVVALDLTTGEIQVFKAKAVLFATGGLGRMFRITSNAYANTGDGQALLARKGVPLEDMEFFQFHPTGIRGLGILITEGVRGEGGILRNAKGEQFMERYAPTLLDLAPRDMIARAIHTEIHEFRGIVGDGSVDDFVHLDATHLGKDLIEEKLPDIAEFSRTYLGIDPAEKPMPVHPTAHYAMGGIPVDLDGRVFVDGEGNTYEGLYAAGECACVSVHGANRLGTNSLVELIVYGRRAGQHMGQYIKGSDFPAYAGDASEMAEARLSELKSKGEGTHPEELRQEMQSTMMAKVGIYRKGTEMAEAVDTLRELRDRFKGVRTDDPSKAFNTHVLEILELGNLLDMAYISATCALDRTESRGAHARKDYTERDDTNWLHHTLAWLRDDQITIGQKPVDISRWEPKPRKY